MKYRIKVKHDQGTDYYLLAADSPEQAKSRMMNILKCPERAILQIKPSRRQPSKI